MRRIKLFIGPLGSGKSKAAKTLLECENPIHINCESVPKIDSEGMIETFLHPEAKHVVIHNVKSPQLALNICRRFYASHLTLNQKHKPVCQIETPQVIVICHSEKLEKLPEHPYLFAARVEVFRFPLNMNF